MATPDDNLWLQVLEDTGLERNMKGENINIINADYSRIMVLWNALQGCVTSDMWSYRLHAQISEMDGNPVEIEKYQKWALKA